jgi:hypothetical protein
MGLYRKFPFPADLTLVQRKMSLSGGVDSNTR